jgi:hypothetical protein
MLIVCYLFRLFPHHDDEPLRTALSYIIIAMGSSCSLLLLLSSLQ